MLGRRWGRVINIASTVGLAGAPYIAAYSASKHALVGLTRSVAAEVAGRGVTVNAVCPGYVATDLATRARDRALKVHEIQGSTFTVTNLGMMGIQHFQAIINPPEAAILAIGAVRDTPVARNGAIEVGKRMALTLCCDHRVVDGAVGARYLEVLADLLEKPESLAL